MKPKILFAFILFFITQSLVTSAQDTASLRISQSKFEKLMNRKKVVVLDVRTPEEYRAGFIGQAVNYNVMDSLNFVNTVTPFDKSRKYLLYCKSGRRSGKALVMMKKMGFKRVYHLSGGISAWKGELNKPEGKK